MITLEHKKALVTGASRGIGRAVTERFLALGSEVWGLGTAESAEFAALRERSGGRLRWIRCDLANLAGVEACIDGAAKEAGGFDILVNNAGITRDNLSFRMSLDDFQKVLDINLTAGFLIARTVARGMIGRRSGSVINMSSVIGIHGNGGQANYAAAKAGLIGITKSLAAEVAGRGVRVNAIAPGFIDTDMTAALSDAVRQKIAGSIPLARLGAPDDVAALAAFLASDLSAYITGQVIPVDGGLFL